MSELKFFEKRDKNGMLIRYEIPSLSYQIANQCFQIISDYETYKVLTKHLPKEYIEAYFKKLFFEGLETVSSQLIINKWHLNNEKKFLTKKIYIENFPNIRLLKSTKFFEGVKLKKKYNIYKYKSDLTNKIWPYYLFFLKVKKFFLSKIKLKNEKKNIFKTTIGVNYIEGHFLENRNDLFWLKNSDIPTSSVLFYFESKKNMERFSNQRKLLEELKNLGVRYIKLWKWYNIEKVNFVDEGLQDLNKIHPKDDIEIWLKKNSKILLRKIEYWYSFFKDQNIKIHLNAHEVGSSNVIRQIALTKLDGCSIGKLRSVPRKIQGDWFGYYPNNSFFVWGKDSAEGMAKTENYFENLIISGYPYSNNKDLQKKELELIKNRFNEKNVKFTLLLIDSVHEKNDNYRSQVIPSKEMLRFYEYFFDWLYSDKDIGIIIKSKYSDNLYSIPKIKNLLTKAKQTERCHVVATYGTESKFYSPIADFSIGISVDMPTGLVQTAISGSRAIIYDYTNLKNKEKNLYSWGENKIIFSNLNELIENLKSFKEKNNFNQDLGDWSKKISVIDSFCDNRGGERIGKYIRDVQKSFDDGLSSRECLKNANKNYAHKWGENQIVKQGI